MRRSLFLIPILCLAAAACQKELPARLEVVQDALSVESPAGRTQLEFTATRSWTATTDAPWCRVVPQSGNGRVNATTALSILFEENNTPNARSCVLTLNADGMTQTVVVTQQHKKGVLIPSRNLDIGPDATTLRIPIWKTTDYRAEVDDACKDWIHLTQTKAMTEDDLSLNIDENLFTAREGTIHIHYNGQEEVITVRQRCGIVKFEDTEFESFCLHVYDTNRDGLLSVDEALVVTNLTIPSAISSIEGLDRFTNLQYLYISANVDLMDTRKLPKLQEIYTYGIRSVLLSGHQSLKKARIVFSGGENPIEVCDCPALEWLEISFSDTQALTIQSCNALQELQISGLSQITSLSLEKLPGLIKCTMLDCEKLATALFSSLPRLEWLDCQNHKVLSDIHFSACSALSYLTLFSCNIHQLDLSVIPSITFLNISDTPLKELNLSGCTHLGELHLMLTALEYLDLSALPGLVNFACYSSSIKSIDFTGLQELRSVDIVNCDLVSLYARNNPHLWLISCPGNKLEHLDVRGCPELTRLLVHDNRLQSIEGLTNLEALQEFDCGFNQLKTLDISRLPGLITLYCPQNQLQSLDLTNNLSLEFFEANNNPGLKDIYLRSDQKFTHFGYDEQTAVLHYL